MDGQAGNSTPYVVAVVLTWKETEMAAGCIRSVLANGYPRMDVVLVDNGSDPPGCPILKAEFPSIETVQLDRNQGFTGGCNRGIERALELGADYVFLLNNDTVVHEEAIGHLVDAMEARPDVAMASALILYPGEEKRIQCRQKALYRDEARHVHVAPEETLSEKHRDTIETAFAPACAVMFRRAALEQVGLFDERLFTNWEDYDLCCRFQDAGWKFLTVGKAEVVHFLCQTTGHISPFIVYFATRNRLICLFRYGRPLGILRRAPMTLRSFYWGIRNYGFTNWPAHRAFLKGVVHFFLGIRGEGGAPSNTRDRQVKKGE